MPKHESFCGESGRKAAEKTKWFPQRSFAEFLPDWEARAEVPRAMRCVGEGPVFLKALAVSALVHTW